MIKMTQKDVRYMYGYKEPLTTKIYNNNGRINSAEISGSNPVTGS